MLVFCEISNILCLKFLISSAALHFYLQIFFIYANFDTISLLSNHCSVSFAVVKQFFESQVYDEYVIKGNAAIFKCQTPSFVADHIDIVDWVDTDGGVYTKNSAGSFNLKFHLVMINLRGIF